MSRKNHQLIDGKLLQTDKKYSNLKMKQKEKINLWINEEIRQYYKEYGKMPTKERFEVVIDRVYDRIEKADIWIPYDEIHKRFYGKGNSLCSKVFGQIQKEQHTLEKKSIQIEPLHVAFSVCKVQDYKDVDLADPFCFIGKTDEENSLVCRTEIVPENVTEQEDGWKAFRIKGVLDFSLIGILAGISTLLAQKGIGIFVISTFNTDYVLVKKENFNQALETLGNKGYTILGETICSELH